jgi:hypothetical protein
MKHMISELEAKYPSGASGLGDGKIEETDDDDGFEFDSVRRN